MLPTQFKKIVRNLSNLKNNYETLRYYNRYELMLHIFDYDATFKNTIG